MMLVGIIGYALRLLAYSPLHIAADLFFPSRVAVDPLLGPVLGIAGYLAVAVFYGILFVLLFGLRDDRNYVWPAILFAFVAGVVNMGILAPALGILREPVWRLGGATSAVNVVRHVVWGAIFGWFINVYAELHPEGVRM
jgi:hypothetical protein